MQDIVIAEPHALCREALCQYLRHAAEHEFSVTGFGDCAQLKEYIERRTPDLILVSVDILGEDDARELTGGKIGMIVSHGRGHDISDKHIDGVFPKGSSCKEFMAGIQEILAGGKFFPPLCSETEMPEKIHKAPQDFNLTAREREVLSYLVRGQSNKDIARALNLQVVTIKLHVRGICRKTGAANRTQAALLAQENGWR